MQIWWVFWEWECKSDEFFWEWECKSDEVFLNENECKSDEFLWEWESELVEFLWENESELIEFFWEGESELFELEGLSFSISIVYWSSGMVAVASRCWKCGILSNDDGLFMDVEDLRLIDCNGFGELTELTLWSRIEFWEWCGLWGIPVAPIKGLLIETHLRLTLGWDWRHWGNCWEYRRLCCE